MFNRATVIGLFAVGASAGAALAQPCPIYLLERSPEGFEVRRELIEDGAVQVYMQDDRFVSLLLPWSVGQSGEVVKVSQGPVASAVRCEAGTTRVTVQKKGVEPRVLAPIERVGRYRMRVSVIPGRGDPAVFIVDPDGTIARDTLAPPTDMFRGLVPLEPGDVSITNEIREVATGANVTGSVELRRGGPYFLTRVTVTGGGEGDVIVDLGASRTLLSRGLLPGDVPLSPLVALEDGPEGRRERAGSAGALGGEVAGFMAARVPTLEMGSLKFPDVRVNVVDSLPVIAGLAVKGIVGTDLLQRGRVTRIAASPGGGRLILGPSTEANAPAMEVPFSQVSGLILMVGRAGDRSIPFILDTGARSTLLTEATARALSLKPLRGRDTFRGLDGTPIEAWAAMLPTITFGTGHLDSLHVNVAPLPVLERLGLSEGGLLGQNLWEHFSALEVDWEREVVRFYGAGSGR